MPDRCFAYHVSGIRCEREGGHDGDHQIVTTWDSDSSWTPLSVPFLQDEPEAEVLTNPEPFVGSNICFACSHAWHDERCPLPGCGCLTAVA